MLRWGSPVGGSTLITSAPQSASRPPADGPAIHIVSSMTLIPSRTPTLLGSCCSVPAPPTVGDRPLNLHGPPTALHPSRVPVQRGCPSAGERGGSWSRAHRGR